MRHLPLLCLGALVVVASASAADPITATLTTSTRQPLVGEPWHYTVAVKDRAGKQLAAKVRLQILDGKRVVGCWKSRAMVRCSGARAGSWIAFNGKRSATIVWPAFLGTGRLEFRAVIVTGAQTLRLPATVFVQPRP
jgi:hypothetical protein